MNLVPIAKGVLTFIPGLVQMKMREAEGTISPRYCYSIWLRYLSLLHANGLPTQFKTIAEIGPGASLGVGIAALLSGSNRYYAFDVARHANVQRNLKILDALVDLLRRRELIPDNNEFPEIKPFITSNAFPSHILTDQRLNEMLTDKRIEAIRAAIQGQSSDEIGVQYCVPWYDSSVIERESIDLIYSQTVLEYIDDVDTACRIMDEWLRPNGVMLHQIDYRSHGISKRWNEHWTYSETMWRVVRGKRPYYYNRYPHSAYVQLFKWHDFKVIAVCPVIRQDGIQHAELTDDWKHLTNEDFYTSGAFFQMIKPA